jgi:tetratricopeptide (TPR) repeat protein
LARLYPPLGDRAEALETATSHLERALAIDPSNASALSTLGAVYGQSWRHREGIELCRKAIQIDPQNPEGYDTLGQLYMWLGFYESALALSDEAIARDPLHPSAHISKARVLSLMERREDALRTTALMYDRFPDMPGRQLFQGNVFYEMGSLARAQELWLLGNATLPVGEERADYYEIALALIAASNGNLAEGRRILEMSRATPYRDQPHLTELAALLHETDYAVTTIAGHPQRNYRWLLSVPTLRALAREPAFAELTRSLYSKWLSDLSALSATLPEQPPTLPDPDTWLRETPGSVETP